MSIRIFHRQVISRLVTTKPSEIACAALCRDAGIPFEYRHIVKAVVFATVLGTHQVYCCLAGGELSEAGQVLLTPVGRFSLESMLSILPKDCTVIMKEVKLGPTPLRRKVRDTIAAAPPGSGICFFGDIAGELDGLMFDAIGFKGAQEEVVP